MTDGQFVYLIMVLIYWWECLIWLPPGAVAGIRSFSRARMVAARLTFSALRGGWVSANVLPPLGTVFVARAWPFCVTEEGLTAAPVESVGYSMRPEAGADSWAWTEVELVSREGKKIFINGRAIASESSPEAALCLWVMLHSIWKAAPQDRSCLIRREMARSWSVRRTRRVVEFWTRKTRALRVSCNLLLLMLFGALPAAIVFRGLSLELLLVGVSCLILMVSIACEFFALHRRLYPRASFDRWQWFILVLLVPQQSIRAHDLLLKAVTAGTHPLALAAATLKKGSEHRREAMGMLYRDLRMSLPWQGAGKGYYEAFRDEYVAPQFERFAADHAEEIAGWTVPDREAGDRCYCPRCFTTFASDDVEKCPECDSVATKVWEP